MMILYDSNNLEREVSAKAKGKVAERAAFYLSKLNSYKGNEAHYFKRIFTTDNELLTQLQTVNPSIEQDIAECGKKSKEARLRVSQYLVKCFKLPTDCFAGIESVSKAPVRISTASSKAPDAPVRASPYTSTSGEKTTQSTSTKSDLSQFRRDLNSYRVAGFGVNKPRSSAEKELLALRNKYPTIPDSSVLKSLHIHFGGVTKLLLAVCWASYQHHAALRKGFEDYNLRTILKNLSPEEQMLINDYREHCKEGTFASTEICPIPAGKLAEKIKHELANGLPYYNALLAKRPPIPCRQWFNINTNSEGSLSIKFKGTEAIVKMLDCHDIIAARRSSDAVSARALPGLSLYATARTETPPSESTPVLGLIARH